MSYEHCDIHDEEATNGCASCESHARRTMAARAAPYLAEKSPQAMFVILMMLSTRSLEDLDSLWDRG